MNFYQNFTYNSTPDTPKDNNNMDDEINDFFSAIAKTNLALTLFGIVGNIMCICVFFQKPLLSRKFNWYLLILAIAEFFFCCIVFANSLIYVIIPPKMLYDLFIIPCFITEYVTNTIDAFCVFLTLLLSIDRLNAILDPINSRSFFTNRFPKRIIFISLILILVLKSPDVILAQRRYISDPLQLVEQLSNSTFNCNITDLTPKDLPVCRECDRYNKEAYIIICGIILPLLLNVIPTIMILISNMILSIYVTNYKKKPLIVHHKKNHTSTGENGAANGTGIGSGLPGGHESKKINAKPNLSVTQKSHHFTIIIIGVWLLLTSAPYYTINTIIRISSLNIFQHSTTVLASETGYEYQAILSVFFNSNHCINILIYLIFHKSFRYNSWRLVLRIIKCDNKKAAYFNHNLNKATMCSPSVVTGGAKYRNGNANGDKANHLNLNMFNSRHRAESLSCVTYNNTETNLAGLNCRRSSIANSDIFSNDNNNGKYKQRASVAETRSMNSSVNNRRFSSENSNDNVIVKLFNRIFRRNKTSLNITTTTKQTDQQRRLSSVSQYTKKLFKTNLNGSVIIKRNDSNEYKLARLCDDSDCNDFYHSKKNLNSDGENSSAGVSNMIIVTKDGDSGNTSSKLYVTDNKKKYLNGKMNSVLFSSSSKLATTSRQNSKDLRFSVADCMMQSDYD